MADMPWQNAGAMWVLYFFVLALVASLILKS